MNLHKGTSDESKAVPKTTKISQNRLNYNDDAYNCDDMGQNRTNLNKNPLTRKTTSKGLNNDNHNNNNEEILNFISKTTNIGTPITRPIMKNSKIGNLYVPNQNYNLNKRT